LIGDNKWWLELPEKSLIWLVQLVEGKSCSSHKRGMRFTTSTPTNIPIVCQGCSTVEGITRILRGVAAQNMPSSSVLF
jgi:hypothetical protein